MKTIDLSDRVTIKQHSARVWKVLVDGSVVFVTHRGEKRARGIGEMWVARTAK